MPGLTNNDNILTADNQLILTQNEQTTAINGVATRISELTAQVKLIKKQVEHGGSGSGGSDVGIPDLEGEEEQAALTPVQLDKKCTLSNYLFDTVLSMGTVIENSNLSIYGTAAAALATGLPLILAGGVLDGPLPLMEIVTVIAEAVVFIILNLSDIEEVVDELTDNKSAIISDLYEAVTVNQARNAFLSNVTLNTPEVALLNIFLVGNVLKILFVDKAELPPDYIPDCPCGEQTDAQLTNLRYTGPVGGVTEYQANTVSGCSTSHRYTTLGVDGCQMTLDVTGLIGGERSIIIEYAIYDGTHNHTITLADGADTITRTTPGCNEKIQLTIAGRDFVAPTLVITCDHTNGVDFYAWSVTAI